MFLDDFVLEVVRVAVGAPEWTAPGMFLLWLLLHRGQAESGE